jgi:hypothetical protein
MNSSVQGYPLDKGTIENNHPSAIKQLPLLSKIIFFG